MTKIFDNTNSSIDAVVAWVDGNDPKHIAKRNMVMAQDDSSTIVGADATRFASVNEIKYCVLSILRFAPFIRNIYIVTDNQVPNIMDDIHQYFPEKVDAIRIVDHSEIFEGYEQYLPTFNSISIESMLWKIKGISNRFIYFNDDFFLVRNVSPEDFFIKDQPVLRGRMIMAPYGRLAWIRLKQGVRKILNNRNQKPPQASFHLGQWNSAHLLNFKYRYFVNSHTPYSVEKNLIEEYFLQNIPLLEKNISFQFRDYTQFTFTSMSNHLQLRSGNRHFAKPDLVYMQPYNRKTNYIDTKLKQCDEDYSIKFLCIQSLDMCTKEEQDKVLNWLEMNLQR